MKITDIKNYDDLVDIVYNHEELIERNYQSKKDQILLHKQLLVSIVNFLKKPEYLALDKIKLIKLLIKDVLELKNSDMIIIKKDYIFIKLYDNNKAQKIKTNTIADRYNGINEDELKSFYDEYFSEKEIKYLFQDISTLFVEKYFLDHNISNANYEKDVFSVIQKFIIEDMASEFECTKEFCLGFSGYIFRKHFRLAFEFIAELLLKEVALSNKNIIKFLKYYSLDIVVVDGKKYKVPELTADNGLRWHVGSIMTFTKVYLKAKEHIDKIQNTMDKLNIEISSYIVNGLSPIEHNSIIQEKYIILAQSIETNANKIDILQDSLEIVKDNNELLNINKELEKLKNERLKLREKKSTLQSKKIKQMVITKYNEIIKKMEIMNREIKSQYKILKQNESSFKSIKSALIKALISKKQLL
ncbi:MAG: hypothetical protein K8R44_09430 [Sulfurimonas sp.]|nr:hypothetical protein [Sulfurimonas sp.]